jgi:hypothetical protein
MKVIALSLSPRYQLFSKAMPRTIVGTEGTIKVYKKERTKLKKMLFFINVFLQIHSHENVLVLKSTNKVD